MIKNRDGWPVYLNTLTGVDAADGGYSLTRSDMWSLYISKEELGDFVPQVGDWILTAEPVNAIAQIIIEGRVIRMKNKAQIEADHEQWKKNLRLERLERYIKHGDALKDQASQLIDPLRERMERFVAEAENPIDFWVEDAGYEMICLQGADALIRKTKELGCIDHAHRPELNSEAQRQDAIEWIEGWWNMNTKEGGYDYAGQMELVPDFGEGHSGFTESAAKGLAVAILEGKEV